MDLPLALLQLIFHVVGGVVTGAAFLFIGLIFLSLIFVFISCFVIPLIGVIKYSLSDKLTKKERVIWILLIFFTFPLGGSLYLIYKEEDSPWRKWAVISIILVIGIFIFSHFLSPSQIPENEILQASAKLQQLKEYAISNLDESYREDLRISLETVDKELNGIFTNPQLRTNSIYLIHLLDLLTENQELTFAEYSGWENRFIERDKTKPELLYIHFKRYHTLLNLKAELSKIPTTPPVALHESENPEQVVVNGETYQKIIPLTSLSSDDVKKSFLAQLDNLAMTLNTTWVPDSDYLKTIVLMDLLTVMINDQNQTVTDQEYQLWAAYFNSREHTDWKSLRKSVDEYASTNLTAELYGIYRENSKYYDKD